MAVAEAVVFLLGPILLLVGGWAVTHPNGGYRAVGGVGSSLAPRTRAFFGVVFMVVGVLLMFAPVRW